MYLCTTAPTFLTCASPHPQMGNIRATVKNQTLLKIDTERRALIVKGSVPGKVGNVVEITPAKLVGVNW
jgi:large subunit ribosomal protein L3